MSAGFLTVGVQARGAEASVHSDESVLSAVAGYLYLPEHPRQDLSAAAALARRWAAVGAVALGEADGEFSAVVHERRRGVTFLCTSLSGTRPLYWCARGDMLVAASEISQLSVGALLKLQLEPEGLIELLSFHGVRADPELTEFKGVSRLAGPGLYRIDPGHARLQRDDAYWAPPPTRHLTRAQRVALPAHTAHTLTQALASVPPGGKFAISGGYDSGLLWLLANQLTHARPPPEAYALIFPGLPSDERPVIQALLRQTHTSAQFLAGDRVKASDLIDDYVAAVDRVLAAPTFVTLHVLARAIAAGGGAGLVTGTGAEVSLEATETYAADLLRSGAWHTLLWDALRFRTYIANEPTSVFARMRYFAKVAVAPPGSRWRRKRAPSPPRWLHSRWHARWRAGLQAMNAAWGGGNYARAERLWLLRSLGSVASENHEQICQWHGLEAYHPYLHRRVLELGLTVPARLSNRGLHTKQLMRDTAQWAMQGRPPPWPKKKIVFDSLVAEDHDLVRALGPARRWGLVDAGVLDAGTANEMAERAARREPVRPLDSVLAIAERYWRRCG